MASRDIQDNKIGEEKWKFETEDVVTSTTVLGEMVCVGSEDNNLYAVDAATGTQDWVFETEGEIWSSPTVVGETVYVGSWDNKLYAVDVSTGAQEWNFLTEGAVSAQTVLNDAVFVGSQENLYKVNATTGAQEWTFESGYEKWDSLVGVDETIYVVSGIEGNLHAVDATTGTEQWVFETEDRIHSSPTVVDGIVYVGSWDNNLYAVDASAGTQEWAFETGGWVDSSATVVDGTVYVGSDNLYALDAATGTQKWIFETGSSVSSSPSLLDETVFVGSADSNLYAVDVTTGKKQWTFNTGDRIESQTVDNETVYIGSHDNSLYAVTTSVTPDSRGREQPKKTTSVSDSLLQEKQLRLELKDDEGEMEQIPNIKEASSPNQSHLSHDDFQIVEEIAHGGQAVVKKAQLPEEKNSPAVVALREPKAAGTLTKEACKEFLKRVKIWQKINSREQNKQRWDSYDHIVSVIDTGDTPFPWIAMEYMDGGDLKELLEEYPDGLPVTQALWTGECVCKGLEIADKLGMSHLDVKPENVLLKETSGWSWPKLADWGLARTLASETGTMDAMSPKYAAPEQFDSSMFGEPDQLTDIYQTGALLHALLTGDPPVTGSNTEVVGTVLSGESMPTPSESRPELSAAIDAAVGLALEHKKKDRYDSITEFRKALNAIRTGERLPRVVYKRLDE